MKYKVIYITRTVNGKRIAEKMSEKLDTDNVNRKGLRGLFRATCYSISGKSVSITLQGTLADYDELIIVIPLRESRPSPAIKRLLADVEKQKVHLMTGSTITHLKDKNGFISVNEIIKKLGNEDKVIYELLSYLRIGGMSK